MGVSAQRKAEPLLARALQLDDALGEAYVLRALLKDKGDTSGAEADYRKGLSLSPNDGPGHELFANFLEREGRIDEALAAIDRARVVDPLYPRSHYFKGLLLLLYGRGSLEEAEALFLQALRVAPNFHPALMRLGSIRWFTGRLAEAANYSERAVAIDPRSIWVRVELSMLYLDLDDPDAARNVIAELADPPPETWVPICLYENDLEGAHRILRGVRLKDIALDQLHIPVLLAVRDRALASGDHAGARELMQAVAEKWDPIVSAADAGKLSSAVAGRPPGGGDYPEDLLAAAQWQKSIGEQRRAEASARAVVEWLDLVEGQAPRALRSGSIAHAPWLSRCSGGTRRRWRRLSVLSRPEISTDGGTTWIGSPHSPRFERMRALRRSRPKHERTRVRSESCSSRCGATGPFRCARCRHRRSAPVREMRTALEKIRASQEPVEQIGVRKQRPRRHGTFARPTLHVRGPAGRTRARGQRLSGAKVGVVSGVDDGD